jgi:hypothetical protein
MKRTCDVAAVPQSVAAAGEQVRGERGNDNTSGITSTTIQWDGVANNLSEDLLVADYHISCKMVFATLLEKQCLCSVKLFEMERGITI